LAGPKAINNRVNDRVIPDPVSAYCRVVRVRVAYYRNGLLPEWLIAGLLADARLIAGLLADARLIAGLLADARLIAGIPPV
jgi:hypothetical protein